MTIRHSSSHTTKPPARITLLDSISRPVVMGQEIGRGGEGSVYDVEGHPSQVAKIYHKRPLTADQVAKLQAMVTCWSSSLETISSWPRALLFDPAVRKPCGILMTKMSDARPLHELYGTTNRRRHFPDAGWHHLVLAARNAAAAFHTLHAAGIVVGDVNQGNLLVDKQMCVRMIDCDSFQISSNGTTYPCPVGTPHFTPPELQAQKLRGVARTVEHDRFGLGVIIFHLLFVGRHPFAGRFRGPGDLPIERAIAERRFAFSRYRGETQVDPPPASLLLDDMPPVVAELFERAFRGAAEERPTPLEWIKQLESLMKGRRTCKFDAVHVYSAELTECPWCRIEDAGGPAFFVSSGGTTTISADRLAVLDEKILNIKQVAFTQLTERQLALPRMPPLRPMREKPKLGAPDFLTMGLVGAWLATLLVSFFGTALGLNTVAVLGAIGLGTTLSIVLATWLILNNKAKSYRATVDQRQNGLETTAADLEKRAQSILAQHRKREQAFKDAAADFQRELDHYQNADENLQDVLVQHREAQRNEYLRRYLIRDYAFKISGISGSNIAMLESFGVESANDLDRVRLYGVPGVDPELVMELTQWRKDVERDFKFAPEHGVTLSEAGAAKEAAVRRFKIAQARKVLTGARQLQALADSAQAELSRHLAQFNRAADQWRSDAAVLRDFQSSRRDLERKVNQSPAQIVACALSVPFISLLLFLLFGRG